MMVSTGGPKPIGPGARWGYPGGLSWFRSVEAPTGLALGAARVGEVGAPHHQKSLVHYLGSGASEVIARLPQHWESRAWSPLGTRHSP
jgi:hypothetical protein